MGKTPNRDSKLGKAGARFVRRRAEAYARDPRKLQDLLGDAARKAERSRERLGEAWDGMMLMFRLLRAYVAGHYRRIPWRTLLMAVAAVLYFVMPFDLIPDWVAGFGYLDDAAVVAWTLDAIRSDLDVFAAWEAGGEHPENSETEAR